MALDSHSRPVPADQPSGAQHPRRWYREGMGLIFDERLITIDAWAFDDLSPRFADDGNLFWYYARS